MNLWGLARQAAFLVVPISQPDADRITSIILKKLEAAVAEEREACARLTESAFAVDALCSEDAQGCDMPDVDKIAAAIRARGDA